MEHYLIAMAVTAGIYAILALGMNVIWGMAGLINLGLVGFFAVGAYTSALLTLKFGWPIWEGSVHVHPAETAGPGRILPPLLEYRHAPKRCNSICGFHSSLGTAGRLR